jgi:hypothetical protein
MEDLSAFAMNSLLSAYLNLEGLLRISRISEMSSKQILYDYRSESARLTLKSRMRRLLAAVDMMSWSRSLLEIADFQELEEVECEVAVELVDDGEAVRLSREMGNIKVAELEMLHLVRNMFHADKLQISDK